jgi:hypothetical protein
MKTGGNLREKGVISSTDLGMRAIWGGSPELVLPLRGQVEYGWQFGKKELLSGQ